MIMPLIPVLDHAQRKSTHLPIDTYDESRVEGEILNEEKQPLSNQGNNSFNESFLNVSRRDVDFDSIHNSSVIASRN